VKFIVAHAMQEVTMYADFVFCNKVTNMLIQNRKIAIRSRCISAVKF